MSQVLKDNKQTKEDKEDKDLVIHKVFSIILTIILVLVVLFMILSIYSFIQIKIVKTPFDHFAGIIALSEQTESMKPTIDTDDIVFVVLNNSNIKENDIIVYYNSDLTITHRLIEINDNTYITLGDNANSEKEYISKDKIIGKVIYIWKVGIWKKVFTEPIVYIPMLLTLMLASFTVLEYKKDHKKETSQRRKDGEEKS